MKATDEEARKALVDAGLEDAAKDVVFPWGFRIIDFAGKKMLRPLTPEEYRTAVKSETGRVLTDEEVMKPSCQYANTVCVSQGCKERNGFCSKHNDGYGGWYCLCNY